ncbi:PIN domain-containing protein [Ghiorsea bivora]|uniref:PIN domain-containing protein n=1 Tax=Ghiorsea bivora TaxID=1485545 RepID=UPI00056EE467|nr:type II toxin-antitoxin system VapC family toxin [Ghiorsea bivora]
MIGIDTNVLVRYIVQDDEQQAALATNAIEACSVTEPGWISAIVLCETAWVLSRAYGYEKTMVQNVLKQILLAAELVVEQQEQAWLALQDFAKGNADFSDYLITHMNHASGCEYTVTFDKKASKHRLFRQLK